MPSPFKLAPLEDLIKAWFVKQAPRPTFAISYPNVARYFCNIGTEDMNNPPDPIKLKSNIQLYLGVELPLHQAQRICDAQEGTDDELSDIDLECVILVARLVANNAKSSPALCRSVARIFADQSGKHLREHRSNSEYIMAEAFEEHLSSLIENV
ncbi:hypothetical protein CBS147347_10321 [Aspergillus niger]|nr:hypothetical protein CBS147347_10321 [Aspergillus niger]